MNITLSYKEIGDWVTARTGKEIRFRSGGENVLQIISPLDLLLKIANITVSIRMVGITNKSASFIYDGSWGMKNAVNLALKFIRYKLPEMEEAIEMRPDRLVWVHLDKIPQLAPLLDNVNLESLTFPPAGIRLTASLKS